MHACARLCTPVHACARLCTPVHACARLCVPVLACTCLCLPVLRFRPPMAVQGSEVAIRLGCFLARTRACRRARRGAGRRSRQAPRSPPRASPAAPRARCTCARAHARVANAPSHARRDRGSLPCAKGSLRGLCLGSSVKNTSSSNVRSSAVHYSTVGRVIRSIRNRRSHFALSQTSDTRSLQPVVWRTASVSPLVELLRTRTAFTGAACLGGSR